MADHGDACVDNRGDSRERLAGALHLDRVGAAVLHQSDGVLEGKRVRDLGTSQTAYPP